jgi:hypothetical protein
VTYRDITDLPVATAQKWDNSGAASNFRPARDVIYMILYQHLLSHAQSRETIAYK